MKNQPPVAGLLHAYCFRNGTIHISQRTPKGALFIAKAAAKPLNAVINALCIRVSRNCRVVPGVPEAPDDGKTAVDAVVGFSLMVRLRLATWRTTTKTVTKKTYYVWQWQPKSYHTPHWQHGTTYNRPVSARDAREQRAAFPNLRYREVKVEQTTTVTRLTTETGI